MGKAACLFPGQGAQTVGMVTEATESVPAARALFEQANEILGYDLLELCQKGPEETLNATNHSQPALYVAGLAAVEILKANDPSAFDDVQATAGLSLGEYTALAFAGSLSFEDGLRVVKVRGESMQQAAEMVPSGMLSVIGLDVEKTQAVCDQASDAGKVWIANYLCPGNLTLSGHAAGLEKAAGLASEAGAMMTKALAVAGAFHTEIMAPAVEPLQAVFDEVQFNPPRIPVICNVDAQPHEDPKEIRDLLLKQALNPVRWEDSMRYLLDEDFVTFLELGPGRVLAGLMKRIKRKTNFVNVGC